MYLDWVGSVLNVVALYTLAKHPMYGMYLFVGSSVSFLVWAVVNQIWSIALLQVLLLILNGRTIYTWRKKQGN